MSGHVDVRVRVAAPLDAVWAAANDPSVWAGAGHPVGGLARDGERVRFQVTTPPDGAGRVFSYQVERIADERSRTVYSRRFDSADFLYSHVWFGYEPAGQGTEMRCVVDFETRPGASLDDAGMAAAMELGLTRNLQETARRIEGATEGAGGR
jgi:hypothetical protein